MCDERGRVISTGRGAVERFDLATGRGTRHSNLDPYTVGARYLGKDTFLAKTTAFVEVVEIGEQTKTLRSVETRGHCLERLDGDLVAIAEFDAHGQMTLVVGDMAKEKVVVTVPWGLARFSAQAMAWSCGALWIALKDGTAMRADAKTWRPSGEVIAKGGTGPGVVLPDGRTWVVARFTDRPVLDVHDLSSGKRIATYDGPSCTYAISAIAYSPSGRVIVGDTSGAVVSIDVVAVVPGQRAAVAAGGLGGGGSAPTSPTLSRQKARESERR
jgi:hypothetical protein